MGYSGTLSKICGKLFENFESVPPRAPPESLRPKVSCEILKKILSFWLLLPPFLEGVAAILGVVSP